MLKAPTEINLSEGAFLCIILVYCAYLLTSASASCHVLSLVSIFQSVFSSWRSGDLRFYQ